MNLLNNPCSAPETASTPILSLSYCGAPTEGLSCSCLRSLRVFKQLCYAPSHPLREYLLLPLLTIITTGQSSLPFDNSWPGCVNIFLKYLLPSPIPMARPTYVFIPKPVKKKFFLFISNCKLLYIFILAFPSFLSS